jgi:nitrogen fixation-related uncharacterized protein
MSDSGQFDDMIGPSMRILHDDDSVHEIEDVPGAGEITKSPNHQIAKSPNHINQ